MTEPTATEQPAMTLVQFPMDMTTREVLAFEDMSGTSVTTIFQTLGHEEKPSTKVLIALMVISRRRKLPRTSWDEIVDAFGITLDFDYPSLKEALTDWVAEQNDKELDEFAEAAGRTDIPKDENDTNAD